MQNVSSNFSPGPINPWGFVKSAHDRLKFLEIESKCVDHFFICFHSFPDSSAARASSSTSEAAATSLVISSLV